jgi:hypothetical protein
MAYPAASHGPRVALLLALMAGSLTACLAKPATPSAVPGIPVYPGARLVAPATPAPGLDPTEGYVVSGASQADVRTWYRQAMGGRGWHPTSPDDGGEVTTYADDRGCWGLVSIRQDGPDVLVQISQQRPGSTCYVIPTLAPGDE